MCAGRCRQAVIHDPASVGLPFQFLDVELGGKGRRRPVAAGGDDLAETLGGAVPAGEDPGNRGLHVRVDRDVAAPIQGDQLPEGGGIGGEADEDEDAVRREAPACRPS